MRRQHYLVICLILATAGSAEAGMPSGLSMLSKATQLRVESLSFFMAGYFLAAYGVMRLWNCLTGDFTWLPRLSYGKALALVTLWALLFIVVLTMISGARELLTPGAWEQNGVTFRLVQP